MGEALELWDRHVIETFLRRAPALHAYELGDLDPAYAPHARWFGWREDRRLEALCLLYSATDPATLLAFAQPTELRATQRLLGGVQAELPSRCYAHLSHELVSSFSDFRHGEPAPHLKMQLSERDRLERVGDAHVPIPLRVEDRDELATFYRRAYPGNWFDARSLDTGCYFGVRLAGEWVAVAGVHVYAPAIGVAALGNVATDPAHRGRGLAKVVTAALCRKLLATVDLIALNVHRDNAAAIACYRALGFEVVADYCEVLLERARV